MCYSLLLVFACLFFLSIKWAVPDKSYWAPIVALDFHMFFLSPYLKDRSILSLDLDFERYFTLFFMGLSGFSWDVGRIVSLFTLPSSSFLNFSSFLSPSLSLYLVTLADLKNSSFLICTWRVSHHTAQSTEVHLRILLFKVDILVFIVMYTHCNNFFIKEISKNFINYFEIIKQRKQNLRRSGLNTTTVKILDWNIHEYESIIRLPRSIRLIEDSECQ